MNIGKAAIKEFLSEMFAKAHGVNMKTATELERYL